MITETHRMVKLAALLSAAALAGSTQAQVEPDRSGVGRAQFRVPELSIDNEYSLPNGLPAQAAANAAADLSALGLSGDSGRVDKRGGRWATLTMAEPLLPGPGKGNGLRWANLGRVAPKNAAELSNAASRAFRGYLEANSHPLRIDPYELANPGKVTIYREGTLIQIFTPRVFNGVPVRGSYLKGTINHGNLTLFGTNDWGDIDASTVPGIPESSARDAVQSHVEPYSVDGSWGKTELVLVPLARGQDLNNVPIGKGYEYRLAWVIRPAFDGDLRHFEALVDAQTGELLSFEDTNQYAATARDVSGGVYPVSNDGIVPDGVEQASWPMPFDRVSTPGGTVTTDSGGNLPVPVDGNITSNLSGPYVHINDNCGAISLTSAGDIDFGTSGGDDCTTPGFGGAGNTHASRTGFHELNRIIEMGRGQLPGNSWLQQQLTSNMNINLTCNAFWGGGTVNFYRSGGGCNNTGEIAGVFDHEWGHGLDDNDAVPTIASPSGEGIADIYAALRLNDSCIGRSFRTTNCSGFGDPCLNCTGVRDIDYLQRQSGQPHDFSWSNANCGSSVHCKGAVYAEAVWSLWKRELQSAPYNYDNNTAHEIVTRLTYIGAGNTGTWFSGSPPNGGCSGGSGYLNYLAADDDNGDLNDGTPHMTAIYNAFNDQEIACGTPTVQDFGCAGTPTIAPVVATAALDKSASLSWGAVGGAASYEVFRTDGVFACDFGKVRIGETTATSFNDSGLQNGRSYSYVVIPKGSSDSCFGPASACATVAPVAGPNVDVDPASAALAIFTGDGDAFIDNCEEATLSFSVDNTGIGNLNNVRITNVTAVSHPSITITTGFPATVSPAALNEGASGDGSFGFDAAGLAFGDTLVFEVSVTADELSVARTQILTIDNAESDLQTVATQTWDFETDLDGWTLIEGTFDQTTAGGGAGGSSGYMASSANLDNQCDQVRSPPFQLTATSTMTAETNYEIENFSSGQWWDRANIAFFEGGTRNAVDPDGGRLYEASGPGATCATTGQNGWANVNSSWGSSSWSASALGSAGRAGETVQLDIAYGTDAAVVGRGIWIDQLTLTDIEFVVADAQSDDCDTSCTVDADCDNGLYCDGDETCNAGSCEAGTPPVCDDGLFCTGAETCNESTDTCDAGTPPACDDGAFCNGTETCNEGTDSCDAGTAPACDDGIFCNGAETCNEGSDVCDAGTAPTCDDGVGCTDDSCNSGTDSCDNVANDANCDNGLFCDGAETCDAVADCQAAIDPCPGQSCDEAGDVCVPSVCDNDGVCEAGEDCNNCANDCGSGPIPGAECGNDICEAGDGENASNCSADCNGVLTGKPSDRYSCGSGGQYEIPCSDSRCTEGGKLCTDTPAPSGSYCCGDATCEGAEDSFMCAIDCGPPPECGDGVIESPEVCDGSNLGGETCSSQGFPGGTLACLPDCSDYDSSGCDPLSCGTPNSACSSNDQCCSGKCRSRGSKAGTCT